LSERIERRLKASELIGMKKSERFGSECAVKRGHDHTKDEDQKRLKGKE
jgi:hypothetical protein